MNYRLASPLLDAQIGEIKLKIRLSMNGIVSGQMTQSGIIYKKNYGVSIPRIREIASMYPPNHDLALRLWNLQIHETMIMATLLEPVDTCTREFANKWVGSFNQIEIVEQSCMNLFCKLPCSASLCMEWVSSGNVWSQITGFTLGARIYDTLDSTGINAIIEIALKITDTDNFFLYKAVALCLSRFCRKDIETATHILKEITANNSRTSVAQHYIFNEVKQEILFLNIL